MKDKKIKIRYFDGKYKVQVTSKHYDADGEEKLAHLIALEPLPFYKNGKVRQLKIGEKLTVLDKRIWLKQRKVLLGAEGETKK